MPSDPERLRVHEAVREFHPNLPDRVEIIDCTLRDGEQAPGVWFTTSEKIMLAKLLDEAGVDVLDAGFPASCPEEIEALQALRDLGLKARIGATARAVKGDILAAEKARAQEVFMFLPTSDIRLVAGLGLSRQEAEKRLRAQAEEVVSRGMILNVVAEDSYRSDPAWLIHLFESLSGIPVARFVICDTVGCAYPAGMERLITKLHKELGGSAALCTHCHNDVGMASANSLAAVMAGARAVTCTVNSVGERAGNADLAEVVAGLTHIYGVDHPINPEHLAHLSDEVERLTGIHTSATKPVTGFNVYSHESGVHVDGMLKDPRSYEFIPAAWTGRKTRYVLGKSSGAALLRKLIRTERVELSDADVQDLLQEMKRRTIARTRSEHNRAHANDVASREQLLSGITRYEALYECRTRASERIAERAAENEPKARPALDGAGTSASAEPSES